MANPDKIRVGVVFGGRSGEHEVSLISAQSVINALNKDKYDVVPIGITKKGSWLVGSDPEQLAVDCKSLLSENASDSSSSARASLTCDPSHKGLVLFDKETSGSRIGLDILFPVVHGTYGEDGTLQGLLELADLPYVGCGVLASAVGMDKTSSKRLFRDAGLPVAPFMEILRNKWRQDRETIMGCIESQFTYPCFVKPVNSGSSVGVSKARNRVQLGQAIDLAAEFDRKILIETYVDARELEVSVLGNDEPTASVVGEIIPCNEFYDYNAKYIDNRSGLNIPANIPESTGEEIRNMAVRAFKVLDCAGMARADFFMDKSTGAVYINELNTIPGFTNISMYPKLWEASGLPYPKLVDRLIELAFERYSEKQESLSSLS